MEGSLQNITLMPGYRYTRQLFANTSAYVGVNVGVLCQNIKDRENWNNEIRADVQKYAYGLAYSMEVGLIRKQRKHLSYFLAYQISGAWLGTEAKPINVPCIQIRTPRLVICSSNASAPE